MSDQPKTSKSQGNAPAKSPEKKKKLASALRENLKRRKAAPRPEKPSKND